MSNFRLDIFNELIKNFITVKKRVLQSRPVSTKTDKINEYINLLIDNYNEILKYGSLNASEILINPKGKTCKTLKHCREQLVRCFGKLNCRIKVPHDVLLFKLIDKELMTDSESDSESRELQEKEKINSEVGKVVTENKVKPLDSGTETVGNSSTTSQNLNMATIDQKKSFIAMCANIIRDNYDGNPLVLDSFIDKVNLIQDLTDVNLNGTLVSFIRSKLEGKAREALPEDVSTVEEIKVALKRKIKLENSKVVAGKIAALQIRNENYTEFAKQTEDLADALERSLVIEGVTRAKAHEMAIEQTVSVCRLNAKSNLVKSILASSTFVDPKDVIAKLVIEQTNEASERQILAFQSRNNTLNNFSTGNSFNRFNGNNFSRGENYRRGNGNPRGFYPQSSGNSRGNYNRNNNFNRGKNRFNDNQHRNNQRNRNPRTLTLNAEVPQRETLGEVERD